MIILSMHIIDKLSSLNSLEIRPKIFIFLALFFLKACYNKNQKKKQKAKEVIPHNIFIKSQLQTTSKLIYYCV